MNSPCCGYWAVTRWHCARSLLLFGYKLSLSLSLWEKLMTKAIRLDEMVQPLRCPFLDLFTTPLSSSFFRWGGAMFKLFTWTKAGCVSCSKFLKGTHFAFWKHAPCAASILSSNSRHKMEFPQKWSTTFINDRCCHVTLCTVCSARNTEQKQTASQCGNYLQTSGFRKGRIQKPDLSIFSKSIWQTLPGRFSNKYVF